MVRMDNFGRSGNLQIEFGTIEVQCRQTLHPLNRLGCAKCSRLALNPENIVCLFHHVTSMFLDYL